MNKLIKIQDKLSRPFILNVVRRGMTALMPIVLTSSLALAVSNLPIPVFTEWLQHLWGGVVYSLLSYIINFSFSYFSVMLAISLSISYVLEAGEPLETLIFAPIASSLAFLLVSRPTSGDVATRLGPQGSFWAIVISLSATWVYIKLIHSKLGSVWNIPAGHDMIYRGAMRAFLPLSIIIFCSACVSFLLFDVCGIDSLTLWLGGFFEKILNGMNNDFAEVMTSALLIHSLWFLGIHGSNAVEAFMSTHTAVGSDIIFSKTFLDVFVLMGGCGTSICIIISILIFSKYSKQKTLARSAALPVLLNINEMITFGLPIIWNPALLIPFLLVPLECTAIAYAAIKLGIVAPVVSEVMWTTPIFISGYLATHSISGAILQLVNIAVGTATYTPFLRLHDALGARRTKEHFDTITKELREAELRNEDVTFLDRTDALGVTANMLMHDFQHAVESRQPYLVFQPQFKADGTCIGAEALIRWKHPTGGFIYPPLMIYLAKKGGFLPVLEEHIFDMACNAIKQTTAMCGSNFKISVNITAQSLKWDGLEKCISETSERFDVSPENLWIEITEQDILSRETEYIDKITRLRERGHKFLIDDFGMGRTSILYLQSNLFDGVKIDGSLTRSILEDKASCEIVSSVIELSRKLNMLVIAEFVDTNDECTLLDDLGCDYYQVYY
ncbi:MAG: PTS sugar transporter subunit IIC/EAL domain-containing protein, partial [Firmicutes bacterium]|nr:PTS sugar transporter subunit IIC/EAL domain-containing protein [Bacillota bacterium]